MAEPSWFKMLARMPLWMQNAFCTIYGVRMRRERYNRQFHRALAFLNESQWWSLEQQREYQNEKLREVIRHAYANVPYYREVMQAHKLAPDDIRTVADLTKLPILEKQTVRERCDDMVARGHPPNRIVVAHTGGTTGTAMNFRHDRDTAPWQWAVWWRHRQRFGLRLKDPFVVFAGRSVVPLANREPPIWRRNLTMHQTYVSVHHLEQRTLPALADYLQSRRVAYYSGYPSALYMVASYLLEKGIRLPNPPRVTVTGAETVLPHQRRVIEEGFSSEVADQYGASEGCGNISECEQHAYHVDMEFGIVEFIPIEGMPSNCARIVCTGFCNPAMPLIRYSIGDVATLSDEKCSCGRAAPTVARIDGRIESYVITPDGRQLGRLDFLFKKSGNIEEAQLVQETLDELILKIVRGPGYGRKDEANLLHDLRQYLGDVIKIKMEYVSEIPREANGKFRQIVSHVFRDRFADGASTPTGRSADSAPGDHSS